MSTFIKGEKPMRGAVVAIALLVLAGCEKPTTEAALVISNRAGGGVTALYFQTAGDCTAAFERIPIPINGRVDAWCVINVKR